MLGVSYLAAWITTFNATIIAELALSISSGLSRHFLLAGNEMGYFMELLYSEVPLVSGTITSQL